MKQTKNNIVPNIVRGGIAIPIKDKTNYYYMRGRKHENGGIDIGKNPRTGLEVEDGEVMHLTKNETKVFSAKPFLDGESPANKILKGENPNKVFNQQEKYKDMNNMNNDGTKRKNNKIVKLQYGGKDRLIRVPSTGELTLTSTRPKAKLGTYLKENNLVGDAVSLGANTIGSIASYFINRNAIDKMEYPELNYASAPKELQAAKLKTRININPQLDRMREDLARYERSIDANTSNSRTALSRKNQVRLANMLQTNELYGNKENLETELINKDLLNRQAVSNQNIEQYNQYTKDKNDFYNKQIARRIEFNNKKSELNSENTIGLVNNLASSITNTTDNILKRKAENKTILANVLSHPNLPIEILYNEGIINKKTYDAYRKAYPLKKQ